MMSDDDDMGLQQPSLDFERGYHLHLKIKGYEWLACSRPEIFDSPDVQQPTSHTAQATASAMDKKILI